MDVVRIPRTRLSVKLHVPPSTEARHASRAARTHTQTPQEKRNISARFNGSSTSEGVSLSLARLLAVTAATMENGSLPLPPPLSFRHITRLQPQRRNLRCRRRSRRTKNNFQATMRADDRVRELTCSKTAARFNIPLIANSCVSFQFGQSVGLREGDNVCARMLRPLAHDATACRDRDPKQVRRRRKQQVCSIFRTAPCCCRSCWLCRQRKTLKRSKVSGSSWLACWLACCLLLAANGNNFSSPSAVVASSSRICDAV